MKFKKYIIMPMMLAMLSVATSCEQEDMPPSVTGSDVVEVTATISSPATRVSEIADNRYVFDKDDKIHIVGWYGQDWADYPSPWNNADDTWWNDATSTYNGSRWKTEPYMRWQNGDFTHYFFAWWPHDFVASTTDLTAVKYDAEGRSAIDFLVASWKGARPDGNTVELNFNHVFARFDLNLAFRNQYTDITNVSATIKASTEARINLMVNPTDIVWVNEQELNEVVLLQKSAPDGENDWSGYGIFIPQKLTGCTITLTFTADGEEKTITYTHPGSLQFKFGYRTTLSLIVGKEKIEIEGVIVTDWDTAPDIDGGKAEEVI